MTVDGGRSGCCARCSASRGPRSSATAGPGGSPRATTRANQEPRFLRNRVRHELIPLLQALQPRAVEALVRLAELAADEAAIVAAAVEAAGPGWSSTGRKG